MPQTTINKAGQPVAVAGQLSDNMEGVDVMSRFSAESSNQIPFGTGVKAATSLRGVLQPTASTDRIEGVVKWGANHFPANAAGTIGDLGTTGLLPKSGFGVLRRGRIYAYLDPGLSSITPYTDRGWCRCTVNGGNNVIGAWSNAQDGTNNIDCTTGTQFVGPLFTSADGTTKIAELECDFTNK
jgi:hypothetical protein